MRVPADVRARLGRSVFVRSTGETDAVAAWDKARPWVRDWRRQIEDARSGRSSDLSETILNARRRITALRANSTDAEDWAAADDALEDLLGTLEARFAPLPAPQALSIREQVTGDATPFATHIDAWVKSLGEGRTASMFASDVRAFSKGHPSMTLEGLDGAAVQAWIGEMAQDAAPKTIERKLSALRNYWGWLQAHGLASTERKPFHGRRLPKAKPTETIQRKPFTPAQVLQLHAKALERHDQALADLIWLGAHTGARIEELCSLKVEHVDTTKGSITIPGTKTEAAARVVPIHSACKDLVARLVAAAKDEPRFLIPSNAENQFGERSAPLSKRFGRLRDAAGFGPELVFHSLRKTVATMFEDAGCPEGVAADILGHDKPTMTYGLYSGGTSLETKRDWLERAVAY